MTSYSTDQYFESGRPWIDPRGEAFAGGWRGDGGPENPAATAAIQAVLDRTAASLFVPPGNYNLSTGGIELKGNGQGIFGVGEQSFIHAGGANVTPLTLSGGRTFAARMSVQGGGFGCSLPTIHLTTGAEEAELYRINGTFGYNVLLSEPGECEVRSCKFSYCYGESVWHSRGGIYSRRNQIDQTPDGGWFTPGARPGSWRANTQITADPNSMVVSDGYILQCMRGGQTGAVPPKLQNYFTDIIDNEVIWRLMQRSVYYGILLDGGSQPNYIDDTDLTGPYWAGIAMVNLSGGDSPSTTFVRDSIVAQCWIGGIVCRDGNGLTVEGGQIANNGQHGILVQGNWRGDTAVLGALVYGNPTFGVALTAGQSHRVIDCEIVGNGTGLYAQGVTGLIVTDNDLGESRTWGANNRAVSIAAPCDDYIIRDNLVRKGGGISDQAGGPHRIVTDNL